MPTLFRLLTILALIAGIVYGIMAALVYFVQPTRSELTIDVPLGPLTVIEPKREGEPAETGPFKPEMPDGKDAGGAPDR